MTRQCRQFCTRQGGRGSLIRHQSPSLHHIIVGIAAPSASLGRLARCWVTTGAFAATSESVKPISSHADRHLRIPCARFLKQFVPRGFAYVSVDVRGTGASEGQRPIDFHHREVQDHKEVPEPILKPCSTNLNTHSKLGPNTGLMCLRLVHVIYLYVSLYVFVRMYFMQAYVHVDICVLRRFWNL